MITLSQNSGVSGLFQIEKHAVDDTGREIPGSRKVVAPLQKNLITNSGLDNMADRFFMARCMIGAGSAEPANSDTQLGSQLAVVTGSVVQGPNDVDEGYNSIVGTYVFGQGAGTGIIAELGVAPPSGNITTRALIKDEGGSPTTITKGPMDVLTVTYQIREYPDQGDTVSQVTNPHTSQTYDVVSRGIGGLDARRLLAWHNHGAVQLSQQASQARAHASGGPLSAWDDPLVTSGALVSSGRSEPAYTQGSYYRDAVNTFDEESGNVAGGITRIVVGNLGSPTAVTNQPFLLQASFDPPIDKDNTKTLIITLRKSWGRYEP